MAEFTTEIIETLDETHDVRTFRLTKPNDFSFIPGQYCLVSFVDNEKFEAEARPFTFSNSPTDDHIELTIKKMGDFTSALFSLKKGHKLKIKAPFGEKLNFDKNVEEDVVFLAGGSGITPFMSALRYAEQNKLPNRFLLFFGNKKEEDIIYMDQFDDFTDIALDVVHCLSDEEKVPEYAVKGRISREVIENHLDEKQKIKDMRWYLCGPPPMTAAMKKTLADLGVPDEMVMFESWELPGKSG